MSSPTLLSSGVEALVDQHEAYHLQPSPVVSVATQDALTTVRVAYRNRNRPPVSIHFRFFLDRQSCQWPEVEQALKQTPPAEF